MQTQIILPSKRRIDTHGILVPFDQLLQQGEVIVEGSCTVQVLTGIDPIPNHMLEGATQVRGIDLYQQIKLGVPGVIYAITFTATTDLENTYTVETKQAVLEDQIPAGPIYTNLYFTTPPYPVQHIEELAHGGNLQSAFDWRPPLDGIVHGINILSGEMRNIVVNYVDGKPDGIIHSANILAGEIRTILITYNILPEGINHSASIREGTLKTVVITYSNWPAEGINHSADIISGTLS